MALEAHDLLLATVDEALRQAAGPGAGTENDGRRQTYAFGLDGDRSDTVPLPGEAGGQPPLQGLVTLLTDVKRSGQFRGLEAAAQGLEALCSRLEERLRFAVVARSGTETQPTATTWLSWGGSTVTVLNPGSTPGAYASHLEHLSGALEEELAQLRLMCDVLSVAGRLAVGLTLGGGLAATLPGTLAALAFAWLTRQRWEVRGP